jgi:alkylhydroperoxidase family enzyme
MTPEMHAELVQVIGMAMRTNGMVTALGVEVDERLRG